MISPVFGHFVQRSLGISFFLTVTVEYWGLPKSAIMGLKVGRWEGGKVGRFGGLK
jgi:hypothetical protein